MPLPPKNAPSKSRARKASDLSRKETSIPDWEVTPQADRSPNAHLHNMQSALDQIASAQGAPVLFRQGDPFANAIERDASAVREYESVLRSVRDAEGALRLKLGGDDMYVSFVTNGRQVIEALLKDRKDAWVTVLDGSRRVLAERDREIERLKGAYAKSEGIKQEIAISRDRNFEHLKRIPMWVRHIFRAA